MQGSTTYPGCWETVTWAVMNKPLYLSKQEMELFHSLRQGDTPMMEKAPLGHNLRPRQPRNNRAVRTNIALSRQVRVMQRAQMRSAMSHYYLSTHHFSVVDKIFFYVSF